MDRKEMEKLIKQCNRFLYGRKPQLSSPAWVVSQLAEMVTEDQRLDIYGTGDLIETFEKDIASILGKEAAVFMPSGTMAQQIALRIWSDRSNGKNVAFHPRCHLEIAEQMGYRFLHDLQGIQVGSPFELMTLEEVKKINQPLSTLLLELPQREIGGQLPTWEKLVEIVSWARAQGMYLHMDGARLWECKPYYQKDYAEIAALFDSVYVSMYKGLGAIAGSVLAGPSDFIAESRVWLRRHGGNLISMYPFILSARYGLENYLPRMQVYHEKALEIAELLSNYAQVTVNPDPPQTNMMHIFVQAEKGKLEDALAAVAKEQQTMLFRGFTSSQVPGIFKTELTVQDGALEMDREEIKQDFDLYFGMLK